MIVIGEASLRYVNQSYLMHYHHERNHQALNYRLIAPELGLGYQYDRIARRDRLSRLLRYYYREAA
jgi:putative transposase